MISGKQRSYLKSLAHDLKPIINIGKNSLTDEVIEAIDDKIFLIKGKRKKEGGSLWLI